MKKKILSLLLGSILFTSCRKEFLAPPPIIEEACVLQTVNPSGRSYDKDSVVSYDCTGKFCGLMPMSTRNYWIYQDSVYHDGVFSHVQFDTLRYTDTYKTLHDGLVWWESNIEIGLPSKFFVNDSAFVKLEDRLFTPGIMDAKKDYSLFPGDSLRYLTSFEDAAAMGRSLHVETPLSCPAGTFGDCIYFEKNARNFRKDQLFFKPGLGIIKYIQEKAPMGTRDILLQQVSTLIKFHFE